MQGDPGDGGINSPGIKGERGVDGLPGPQVLTLHGAMLLCQLAVSSATILSSAI
jgi:hypothetical protein